MSAPDSQSAAVRWLIDPPLDGPANMARDEAILACVGEGSSPPTLRFYRWDPPTISLGYFQAISDYEALADPAGSLAVVRRLTGGGAILHDRELTYSLTVPSAHPLIQSAGPNGLYAHVHAAFAALLARYGVPVVNGPAGPGGCSHDGPFSASSGTVASICWPTGEKSWAARSGGRRARSCSTGRWFSVADSISSPVQPSAILPASMSTPICPNWPR